MHPDHQITVDVLRNHRSAAQLGANQLVLGAQATKAEPEGLLHKMVASWWSALRRANTWKLLRCTVCIVVDAKLALQVCIILVVQHLSPRSPLINESCSSQKASQYPPCHAAITNV